MHVDTRPSLREAIPVSGQPGMTRNATIRGITSVRSVDTGLDCCNRLFLCRVKKSRQKIDRPVAN